MRQSLQEALRIYNLEPILWLQCTALVNIKSVETLISPHQVLQTFVQSRIVESKRMCNYNA